MEGEAGRMEMWKRGMLYFQERPLIGYGIMSFPRVDQASASRAAFGSEWRGKAAHNSFLQVRFKRGLIGLSVFLCMIGGAVYRLALIGRRTRGLEGPGMERLRALSDALMASFAAYMVVGLSLSYAYSTLLMAFVALVVVDYCVWRLRLRLRHA